MIPRYFGIDTHKHYVLVAAVDAEQEALLKPTRVSMADLPHWAARHLTAHDQVTLEVGSNTWSVVDTLRCHAGQVIVANPYKTKLIAEAHIKNDKVDAIALAKLLAARFIPAVWVPEDQVREQRGLAAHRATLQKQRTQVKNRVHHLLRQLDMLEDELNESDLLIARLASQDPRLPYLMQITGIGYYTAFAILAAIGHIDRFPWPDKLAAYGGLVPRQHQSGDRNFHGHITKAGNPLLRWLMVEAARAAIRWDPHWRQVHDRIARRRGSNIAVVAVARRLLVLVWHLLTKKDIYRYLQPQTFVTKLQNWAYRIGRTHLPNPSTRDFVHALLSALGLHALAQSLTTNRNGQLRVQSA